MKKKFKCLSGLMALTVGLTMLSGCGKKDSKVDPQELIDKYAAFCELGQYKGVEYTETKTEVTDAMVDYQSQSVLVEHSTSENVYEGTAEIGDKVNIDFVGAIDGVEFEGGNTQGAGYEITLGSGGMIDDFEEQIAGHEVGDTFNVNVTFPDDYGKEELNGKDAVFETTLNYIVQTTYPDMTDEFIASNTDYTTVDEYKSSVRADLELQYAESDEAYNKSAVITVVMDNSKITSYPEQEMQELIDEAIDSVQSEAASYNYDLATYVSARYGMESEDAFREYVANLAESYMKEKILICAIAKAESITVNDDDIKAEKEYMMTELEMDDEEEFDKHYKDEDVVYYAISDKVYDFLLDNGKAVAASDTDADKDNASDTDASASDADKDNASDTDASASDAE